MTREHKGGTAKKLVLDEEPSGFWARVHTNVALTMPLFRLLRRHDSSAPTIGKVYSGWFEIGEIIKELSGKDEAYEEAADKFDERWAYAHSDIASAAYVCDPEFINHDQAGSEEVMSGFMNTLEKVGILMEVRKKYVPLAFGLGMCLEG